MDKLFYKLFFIVLLALWSLYYAFPWSAYNIDVPFSWQEYRLGLDLQGWVELDYKVDLAQVQQEEWYSISRENSIIEGLKSIIDKRVEALNINDSVITTSNYGWEKHIIVQIPLKWTNKEENDLNIKRAKEAIGRVMKIEFKEARGEVTQADLEERHALSLQLLQEAKESQYGFWVTQSKYKDSYENITIGTLSGTVSDLSKYFTLDTTKMSTGWLYSEVVTGTGLEAYSLLWSDIKQTSEPGFWVIDVNSFSGNVVDFDYAFVSSNPSPWKPAQDSKGRILNDKYFINSSVQYSQAFQPMVELTFNTEWAEIFGELTQRLKGKEIAIFVGWELLTAPTVNDTILTGKAVITGNYTPKEAAKLSNDINTWVVPAPIYLTSERTIDSKLWANSLVQLIEAWVWGFLLILCFLVVIYRIGWFLSAIALFIYVTLILAIVKAFWIVLTLAGIAGLILSVWMAIDANILIFERIKDAIASGQKLDKAIKEWFEKSWSAIWDSNITWIIVALILFIFWVNMIKWFGFMLWVWLVVSLFSAMFISRLFILVVARKKNLNLKWFLGIK